MGAHKPPRKPRRAAGWGFTWLHLLKGAKTRDVQFSIPMEQPMVAMQDYNTEADVAAAQMFINHVPDDDYPSQTHGDILCETLCGLSGITREPCLMDGMAIYPEVGTELNLWVVIPSMAVYNLPAAVAKLGFLGLFACAWRNAISNPIPPGKLHVMVLRAFPAYGQLYEELRECYRHEAQPVPTYMWASPDALLQHMKETYTFPCNRWWGK